MRTEKSLRNISFGLGMQFVNAITGLLTRTVLIKALGVTIAGMGNLFTEVISVLSMAELGIGSAIIFHLYKPLAEGDNDRVCRLMSLYRQTYHVIAGVILALGLALLPLLPYLITKVDISIEYINTIYILFVVQTSTSYLLTYKAAIFEASQDQFWVSLVRGITRIVVCAAGIVVVRLTKDYVFYMLVSIVGTLGSNQAISMLADRKFPYLREKKSLSKEERKDVLSNVKHMFIGRLSGRITNSTDNILISTMVSTAQVGYYGNYSLLITSVRRIADQIGSATVGSIGNMMMTEDGPTCSRILRRMTLVFYLIGSGCACVMMAALNTTVTLWLGADFVMRPGLVFVCVMNFFLIVLRSPVWSSITPSGMFKQTKYVSILGTVTNLIVSVLFTLRWGMIGIFAGTTVSIVIQLALDVYLIWRRRLNVSPWEIGRPLIAMFLINLALMGASYWLSVVIQTGSLWGNLALLLAASGALSLSVNLLVFHKTEEFSYLRWLLRKVLKKAASLLRKLKHREETTHAKGPVSLDDALGDRFPRPIVSG